jgi:hypothetical protein
LPCKATLAAACSRWRQAASPSGHRSPSIVTGAAMPDWSLDSRMNLNCRHANVQICQSRFIGCRRSPALPASRTSLLFAEALPARCAGHAARAVDEHEEIAETVVESRVVRYMCSSTYSPVCRGPIYVLLVFRRLAFGGAPACPAAHKCLKAKTLLASAARVYDAVRLLRRYRRALVSQRSRPANDGAARLRASICRIDTLGSRA